MVVAVRNRVVMKVPDPAPGLWDETWATFQKTVGAVEAYDYVQWYNRFPAVKQKTLKWLESATPKWVVTPMVKVEKQLVDVDFDPRLISMREPEYQAAFGPLALAASEAMKVIFGPNSNYTYASGYTMADLATWLSHCEHIRNPYYYSVDFSRFDAHVSAAALQFQYKWMETVFGRKIGSLWRDIITNGWHPNITYSVNGTRKSGNSDTTFGNSLINLAMWQYVFRGFKGQYRVIVMGDDSLVVTSAPIYPDYVLTQFGFTAKVIMTRDLRQASFCSCRFYALADGTFYPAVKVGRMLSKSGWALHPQVLKREKWLGQLAYTLYLEYVHVPVARAIVLRLARHTLGREVGYAELHSLPAYDVEHKAITPSRRLMLKRNNVTSAMIASFAETYLLSEKEVKNIEDRILEEPVPMNLSWPTVDAIVSMDV
jgi:hypothetical protein